MKLIILAIVFLGICHTSFGGYVNSYDKTVNFQCPSGQHIYRIKSVHSNHHEDRRWEFFCRSGYVSSDCSFTSDYINSYDKVLDYKCPNDGIVTGLYSVHSNHNEDRRWKVRCCKLAVKKGTSCYTTNYINSWDNAMDHNIGAGKAIVGLYSYHDNHREDRRWKLKICSFTTCRAVSMKILDVLRPSYTGRFMIGIVTEQGCSSAKHVPNLGESREYSESTTFTTSSTKEFNFGTTLSVSVEASAKLFGAGVAVTYGIEQSFGGAISTTKEESTSTSLATATASSSGVEYNGPGAIMIVGWKDEYRYNTDNVNVEYDIQCDNGSRYKERGKVTLSSKSYGKTHFTKRVAHFSSASQCTWTTESCIANIRGDQALDVQKVIDDFTRCFPNNIANIAK